MYILRANRRLHASMLSLPDFFTKQSVTTGICLSACVFTCARLKSKGYETLSEWITDYTLQFNTNTYTHTQTHKHGLKIHSLKEGRRGEFFCKQDISSEWDSPE